MLYRRLRHYPLSGPLVRAEGPVGGTISNMMLTLMFFVDCKCNAGSQLPLFFGILYYHLRSRDNLWDIFNAP